MQCCAYCVNLLEPPPPPPMSLCNVQSGCGPAPTHFLATIGLFKIFPQKIKKILGKHVYCQILMSFFSLFLLKLSMNRDTEGKPMPRYLLSLCNNYAKFTQG